VTQPSMGSRRGDVGENKIVHHRSAREGLEGTEQPLIRRNRQKENAGGMDKKKNGGRIGPLKERDLKQRQ